VVRVMAKGMSHKKIARCVNLGAFTKNAKGAMAKGINNLGEMEGIMRLYHCSDIKIDDYLIPGVGETRHDGEDSRFVNVSGIWFSDDPKFVRRVGSSVQKFRYEVEIPKDDANLERDNKIDVTMKVFNHIFGDNDSINWYFYKEKAKIVNRTVWDGNQYVVDPEWNSEK